MAKLAPGTPVFFRLKSPRNAIAGYGFYSHFVLLGLRQAWNLFGAGNGGANLESFLSRFGGYRGMDLLSTPSARRDPWGCTILRDCLFWPQERWLPWGREQGWAPNIVQGKTERDAALASRLLGEIQFDAMQVPEDLGAEAFVPLDVDERELVLASQRQRVGQGAFRSRLLGTYERRCAITRNWIAADQGVPRPVRCRLCHRDARLRSPGQRTPARRLGEWASVLSL